MSLTPTRLLVGSASLALACGGLAAVSVAPAAADPRSCSLNPLLASSSRPPAQGDGRVLRWWYLHLGSPLSWTVRPPWAYGITWSTSHRSAGTSQLGWTHSR